MVDDSHVEAIFEHYDGRQMVGFMKVRAKPPQLLYLHLAKPLLVSQDYAGLKSTLPFRQTLTSQKFHGVFSPDVIGWYHTADSHLFRNIACRCYPTCHSPPLTYSNMKR